MLSGDDGPIAWSPNSVGEGCYFIQWIGVDDEAPIEIALRGEETTQLLNMPNAEELQFRLGMSGQMRLLDSSEFGDNLRNDTEVPTLRPGSYRMRAAYLNSPKLMIVVRQISSI